MSSPELQEVADAVVQLAKRQGHVSSRDVRAELRIAGLSEKEWKSVIALTRDALIHRQARYYHKDTLSPHQEKEHARRHAIQKAINRLVKQHRRKAKDDERRGQKRVDFIQPVKVRTEDGKEYALLCRDLSTTGIRMLGAKRLLGQKVDVELFGDDGQPACRFTVRILWTCAVGDELFENGGNFLELLA
jgi:hypothetical protein